MTADDLPAWSAAFVDGSLGEMPRLGLPDVITRDWAYGARDGAGVKVAVVDSGVEHGHPDVGIINGAVAIAPDADAPDGWRAEEGPHDDLYGHGTACASVIRALAPACELYSVRVLNEKLTGRARCFHGGVEWAIDHGMHVVNLSLSTSNEDWYPAFCDLADQALHRGVALVCALANEPKVSIPSEFASVFSVAAIGGTDREVYLANPRPPAEWGAVGIDVTLPWARGSTFTGSGNSFAAPVISGHIARILGAHPGLRPWQLKSVLAELAAHS